MSKHPIDLAINIHSFSECTLNSLSWWLDILKQHKVPNRMIVPNAGIHGGTRLIAHEKDIGHLDFLPAIRGRGYELKLKQPKFTDSSFQK